MSPGGSTAIEIGDGWIRGIDNGAVAKFLGIPYGQSPAGLGRFRPPRPVGPWTGTRDATRYANVCVQVPLDGTPGRTIGIEDCLAVNVWAPREAATPRPVMVWLHGGGHRMGSGNDNDATLLAERCGVVVVAVSHRLNIFGNLFLAGVSEEFGDCANAGMLDIVEALRWVRLNIAAFGGDPHNVTVFGCSGGGMKVSCLLAMPSAAGLFHRAIIQSGAQRCLKDPDEATFDTMRAMAQLGVDKSNITRLFHAPAEQLHSLYLAAAATRPAGLGRASRDAFTPVLHELTMPFHPDSAGAYALNPSVPVIIGHAEDDAGLAFLLFPAVADSIDTDHGIGRSLRQIFPRMSTNDDGAIAAIIRYFRRSRPDKTTKELFSEVATEFWMGGDAFRFAENREAAGCAPVRMYRFGWKDWVFGGRYALHGVEVPFVFGNPNGPYGPEGMPDPASQDPAGYRYRLSHTMMNAWTGFATDGAPLLEGEPWPAFNGRDRRMAHFGRERSTVTTDPVDPAIREMILAQQAGLGS